MTSEFVTLKSLAHVITKGTTPTKAQGYTADGINFIRALSIDENGQLDEGTFLKISDETNDDLKRSIVQEGDVLYTIAGVIGRVTVVGKKHLPANLNQALAIIRPKKDKINSRYLANLLRSHDAQFYLKSRVVESVQANLSLRELGRFPVEELPLAAQNNRNKALELIEEKIRNTSLISDISENVISSLFRSWFIDFDPVKAKAEGKLPHGMDEETAALFPDSFEDSELGKIPAGWEIVSLADCIQANARVGWKGLSVSEYVDSGPYIVTGPQLVSGNIDWQKCGHVPLFRYEESPDIMLQENDVLLTKDGTIGKVALVHSMPGKATLAAGLFRLRAKKEVCGHGFVLCLLNSYLFDSLIWTKVEGAVIPHLYQVHLRAFKFAIPGPELMFEFEKRVNLLIELMKKSAQTITHLERTRYALLPRLMSGELEIPMEA